MPTVLRVGAYRLFFYSSDGCEPAHIHVEMDNKVAKFWLEPVRFQNSGGFSRIELRRVNKVIDENQSLLLEAWNDYFGS